MTVASRSKPQVDEDEDGGFAAGDLDHKADADDDPDDVDPDDDEFDDEEDDSDVESEEEDELEEKADPRAKSPPARYRRGRESA